LDSVSLWDFTVAYRASTQSRTHVLRPGGPALPRILGRWVPLSEEDHELYNASLLALVKPWRTLGDLTDGGSSFAYSFGRFMELTDDRVRGIVRNIGYLWNLDF
jgi:hypothetical protein